MFGWQPNMTKGQRRSCTSDTDVANNWELPGEGEGEESSEGESDIQDDWEERINLVCTEYGLTKPHRQAQYRERAIKIVDEFTGNEPDKLVRGSSKYYDTIIKMFARLTKKYRQNRDSKQLGFPTPEVTWTPGCSIAHTGEVMELPLPKGTAGNRPRVGTFNNLEPLTMIARRTVRSPPKVKQENTLGQDLRLAFDGHQRVQKDRPPHMSRVGKVSATEPTPSESTSYPMVRNPPRPIPRWETYDETHPHLNEPAGNEGYKSFNNPAAANNQGSDRAEMTTEIVAPANAMWSTSRGNQKRPE